MLSADFGVEAPRPFPLLANNLSAITLTKDIFHSRTKQIDTQFTTFAMQWKREKYGSNLDYVLMEANVVAIFTKALARPEIETFTRSIGLSWLPAD